MKNLHRKLLLFWLFNFIMFEVVAWSIQYFYEFIFPLSYSTIHIFFSCVQQQIFEEERIANFVYLWKKHLEWMALNQILFSTIFNWELRRLYGIEMTLSLSLDWMAIFLFKMFSSKSIDNGKNLWPQYSLIIKSTFYVIIIILPHASSSHLIFLLFIVYKKPRRMDEIAIKRKMQFSPHLICYTRLQRKNESEGKSCNKEEKVSSSIVNFFLLKTRLSLWWRDEVENV